MKDKSFDRAMKQIVGQHEAIIQEEIQSQKRAEKRQRIFSRVRLIFIILLIAAVAEFVFNYFGRMVTPVASSSTAGATNHVAGSLKGAQQNAAERDALIDQISK